MWRLVLRTRINLHLFRVTGMMILLVSHTSSGSRWYMRRLSFGTLRANLRWYSTGPPRRRVVYAGRPMYFSYYSLSPKALIRENVRPSVGPSNPVE